MSVKESVFPFAKFPGVDIVLGPEMRSTGEVMGIDRDFATAFAKSQIGRGQQAADGGDGLRQRRRARPQGDRPRGEEAGRARLHADEDPRHRRRAGRARHRGDGRPQDPRGPAERARPPGQRRDRPDRQHAQRQGLADRRGPDPRLGRQPRRAVHHDDRRRQGRGRGAGDDPQGAGGGLCVAGSPGDPCGPRRADAGASRTGLRNDRQSLSDAGRPHESTRVRPEVWSSYSRCRRSWW